MLQKIDYDKYQDILKQYHDSKNPSVRSILRSILKENAASYRIERKEALLI